MYQVLLSFIPSHSSTYHFLLHRYSLLRKHQPESGLCNGPGSSQRVRHGLAHVPPYWEIVYVLHITRPILCTALHLVSIVSRPLPLMRERGSDFLVVSSPGPNPSQGKDGLVTLVKFFGIQRTILERPIRFLDFTCHIIVTFKTACNYPGRFKGRFCLGLLNIYDTFPPLLLLGKSLGADLFSKGGSGLFQ